MITEEQIKKVARKILGEENKDWYFSHDTHHGCHIRRVDASCPHCLAEHHVVYDLREHTVDPSRMRQLKFPNAL